MIIKNQICRTCGVCINHNFYSSDRQNCKQCHNKRANRSRDPLVRLLKNMYCSSKFGTHVFPNKIGLKYIICLYEKQKGKCFYSGIDMKLSSETKADPFLISVDRIISNKGYVEGNIVLCCLGMNWLKNRHSEEILFHSLSRFYMGAKTLGKVS